MATTIVNLPSGYELDDFDETKNFHRILFRPGYSVQARELTQLQTALQAQIDRHGQYSFKDGSRVVNGKVTLNVEYDFIKITSTAFTPTINSYSGAAQIPDNYLTEFVGTTITSASGVTAVVQAVIAEDLAGSGDPATLYVKYTGSGTNNTTSTFVGDEEFFSNGNVVRYGKVVPAVDTPTGYGSAVNIEEGVYFISGTFVYVPAGTLILDKYTNTPNYIIGLKVTEDIVDSIGDTTLLDNAAGTPNAAAPGARRYRISTTLIKEPLNLASRVETDYITLVVIEGGKSAVDRTDKNQETELTERLARRTFEESGDYSVNPYQLNIKEHLDTGTNNGYLTSGNGGSATKLAIGIEPNTSYVKGFRVENTTTKYLAVDKPRGANATIDINQTQQTLNLGNYIRLNEASSLGMPDIATFETIDLYDAANGGGTLRGTCRARGISRGASDTELYLYIFDIQFNSGYAMNNIVSVEWDDGGTVKFRANTFDQSGVTDRTIYGSSFNSLVYKLPYSAVDTLRDPGSTVASPSYNTTYVVRETRTTNASNPAATISGAAFVNASNVVAYIKDGSSYGALDANPTASIVGNTITFTTIGGSSVSLSASQQIVFSVDVSYTGASPKSKTKTTQTSTAQSLSNGVLSLGKADIKKITSIVDPAGESVINRFILDNGQRDNFYDIGKITLKSGEVDPGAITVVFDWYDHSGSGDFFSVDSYDDAEYTQIPSFSGNIGTVQLRDCIDFRPRINDAGTGYASGTNQSLSSPPVNSGVFVTDLTHFLPRIDKLYVTRKGEFKIETGVPSSSPRAPSTPDDAMGIYDIRLSPYVFSLSGVKPKLIENKRFTMANIGSLDKRIKNLEYFTSLSLLEQSASSIDITDGTGATRLKNGFIVDNFTNHGIGDISNPDYACSIDRENGILRPKFDERNVNLVRLSGDTGAVVNDGLVTLPMGTDVNYINQPYASTFSNVNPYNVFSWAGTIKLSPDSDEWKEVDVRPIITVDDSSSFEQFQKMAEQEGILGTVWNEWETNWTGIDVDEKSETTGNPRGGDRGRGRDPEERRDFWWTDGEPETWDINDIETADGAGQNVTTITTTTTTTGQSRGGIKTTLAFDTILKSNGSKVVEMNFIPFIRSRKIFFKAELLKPNTKVYGFFDGASIADYIKEESSFTDFTTEVGISTFEGETSHPDTAGALISNASGVVEGSFIIPRNNALKFAVGTREFRLTDSSTNDKAAETTFAEAQYHAQGMLEVTEEKVISTKVPRLVQSELNDERTLVDTQVSEKTEYIDPVAETFLIDKDGGLFVKSVDLFFRAKAASIPVRVTIRTVLNGTPTQRIVPGGDKILYPGSVNLPSDSSANNGFGNADVATNFAFDYPVYLAQDTEYAIVITSQSDDYEVYVAEMGGQDLTNTTERITKQPYNGVFFTSANASTWTPEQSKDLKFKLNRATFTGSGSKIIFVNDIVPPRKLQVNPFNVNGTTTCKVFHKNHGMYSTSNNVTIAGATGANAALLNKTHSITAFTHDTYDITLTSAATGTGYVGGAGATATENRHMDVMYPYIENIQVPGTSIRFFLKTRTTTSVNGTETRYALTGTGDGYEILPNRNYRYVTPQAIYSAINETSNIKSFQLTAVLTTDNEALSPVIDMNRLSVNTIQNRISSNGGSENTATGGTEVARYITKKIELAEQADIATVYINALKPGGADIDFYWRATSGDEDITASTWTLELPVTGTAIPFNDSNFQEVQYDIDPFGAGSSFSSIQFKIVLQGEVSSTPPLVKDFRAICAT
jgi:hypothetical protein